MDWIPPFVPFLLYHAVIWIIHIYFKSTLVGSSIRIYIFYISIHTCLLFRKLMHPRNRATEMWGRRRMWTSLEINRIFPKCLECCYLHSRVIDSQTNGNQWYYWVVTWLLFTSWVRIRTNSKDIINLNISLLKSFRREQYSNISIKYLNISLIYVAQSLNIDC